MTRSGRDRRRVGINSSPVQSIIIISCHNRSGIVKTRLAALSPFFMILRKARYHMIWT